MVMHIPKSDIQLILEFKFILENNAYIYIFDNVLLEDIIPTG